MKNITTCKQKNSIFKKQIINTGSLKAPIWDQVVSPSEQTVYIDVLVYMI